MSAFSRWLDARIREEIERTIGNERLVWVYLYIAPAVRFAPPSRDACVLADRFQGCDLWFQ